MLAQEGPPPAVLVVDNGSSPANRRALADATAGRCEVLWLPRNLGFAGGMNAGIRHAARAGHEYVWLLNNDAFPAPDCLRQLTAAMAADPRLAAVTPALFYPDGREQHAGARIRQFPCEHETLLTRGRDRRKRRVRSDRRHCAMRRMCKLEKRGARHARGGEQDAGPGEADGGGEHES